MQNLTQEQLINMLMPKLAGKKFLYIVGNGGSGKSTLAEFICNKIISGGEICNLISTDNFVVDTKLRKSAQCEDGGYYTTCVKGSYFLPALETIILALQKGMDCFYQPKRADAVLLSGKAKLNIIEGIGAAFLPKLKDVFKIKLVTEKETELGRRQERDKTKLTPEELLNDFEIRNRQYAKNVEPILNDADLVIVSNEDFTYKTITHPARLAGTPLS